MLDTTTFKHDLETKLTSIRSALSGIATHNPETDDWEALPVGAESPEPDENDEADVVEEWNERRATVSVLETDYRNLTRALAKIADGSYGLCEVSGEPIEEARLHANPAARTCIAHREDEGNLSL
ncbi:TraR/DksA family transcriptional regulator [Patescibacteria group bacterium]|nr:TraR/DksA family transcriptional regulator [Patescibacteria group bacterium]